MSEVTLIRNPESPVVVIQPTTTTITAPDNMDAAETATQAALEANLARNDAQGSAAAADADRIAAETARTTAQAAATEATAQATAADASADAAAASASAAASSATQASSSQSAAAASATTAAAQAAAADAAQSQAATSASQALASKNAAEAAQSVVAASAQDAADQADLAETYKTAAEIAAGASLTNASQAGVHRVEAEGFADAAETSALAAASSASSASADKTATAADRVATGADRLASAASATAADGSADAALVSAVNAANSASSALSSKSAAETARDTAVTARTAAENAADTAESANAAAQSASSTAQTARSAAETARAAAEGARDQAATSAGQASASATAAASSASAAAGSEMTVQLDRIAAAASATASEASAVASQTSRLASEAARDASISAKTASETARDAAQIAKTAAETAETNAETAEVAAEAAQGAAETARNAAQTSAGQASASKDAAALSATAAATSATEADADRVAAQTARTGSEAARDAAQTAQSGAETARTAAQTARTGAETARTGAETAQTGAQVARTGAEAAQVAAAGSLSLAISQASTASSQASLAAGHAASASSVVQQDLSGITAQALHRSPNAITAMAIYDTSKDSDGGAWTEKCQHTSWYNEPLSGRWITAGVVGGVNTEIAARALGGTLGANLMASANNTTTGWVAQTGAVSIVGGRLRLTNPVAGGGGQANWTQAVTAGKQYLIKASGYLGTSTAFPTVRVSGDNGGSWTVLATNSPVGCYVISPSTNSILIQFANQNTQAGWSVEFSDFSLQEILGFAFSSDYFQLSTDGKFYRLWKNLFARSADLTSYAITPTTGLTSSLNAGTAPDGTNSARLLTNTATSDQHRLFLGVTLVSGVTYTYSVYARRDTADWMQLSFNLGSATTAFANYNLATGAKGTEGGTGTATITPVGGGWYRCTLTATTEGPNANVQLYVHEANHVIVNPATTGSSKALFVWGAQLEYGSVATTYEPKAAEGSSSEVFRGNKADFPRLAAIVAEGTNVNIYDLTEPGRPMWMRFISNTSISTNMALLKQSTDLSCVATGQGKIIVLAGSNSGYHGSIIDFPLDGVPHIINGAAGSFAGNIAQRNSAVGRVTGLGGFVIGGTSAGAVAMTVLPDAPIDTVTGLRVPTIAVATNSSVSVIKHNGTVVNGGNLNSFNHIYIDKNILMFSRTGSRGVYYATNPGALGPSFGASLMGNDPDQYQAQNPTVERFSSRTTPMRFATPSVHRKWNHEALPARGLNMAVSSTFNTGWLPGDIRRAYLSDATSESIGPGGNIVTNGDFATDVTGWTPMNGGSIVWSSGSAVVTGGAANTTGVYQPITCVVGKTYRFQVTVTLGTTTIVDVYVAGNATGGGGAVSGSFGYLTSSQTFIGYFTATATTHSVALQSRGVGLTATFDNVSVTEAVLDRSYKSATAPIFGTLTKAALATGTSLVGYSGFSAANYLREAYSPELEFGTGEWSCSAWVNVSSTTAIKGNLVNGSAVASSWGFALFGISVLNTGETIAGFGTVSKLRWSAGDGPMGREIGSNQVFSFYVKKAEFKILYVRADQSTSVYPSGFWFDMDTGTVLSNTFPAGVITATAAPEAGAGWYRIAVKGSHGNYVKIFVSDDTYSVYHGNTTSGYLICGAQLEVSSVPGPFVQTSGGPTILTLPVASRSHTSGPALTIGMNSEGKLTATSFDGTTTRTVTTSPIYNSGTWLKAEACYTTDGTLSIRVNGREVVTSRGNPLLSLNSRYNLLLNSEQFDLWGKNQVTVSSNATIAPNGTPTADLILDNTANAEHYVSQSFSCTNGIAYNFTGYLKQKPGSYSTCNVRTYLTGAVIHIVDFDAGTITNGGTLTSVGDGWYKFDITRTASATGTGYLETYTKQSGSNIGTGSDGHYAWGFQVAAANAWNNGYAYQRVGSATDFDFAAPLTIGNNFAADAPFPGSIALLKLGTTVPTYEQSQFMYEQEKQLFRAGAQSVLPDSGSIVDMAYDDATDRWVAVSATNESYWTGLVRNSVTPVPAGSYTRVVAGSGLELVARSTTNPGVDVTIPAYGLREELVKRAEAAARLTKEIVTYDYVGGFTANTTNGSTAIINVSTITYPASYIGARISGSGIPANTTIVAVSGTTIYLSAPATATATGVSISFLDFDLPVGMEAKAVLIGGSLKQEGTTKDYTRLYDGFIEIIRFAVAPGATAWVQIQAQRITLQ